MVNVDQSVINRFNNDCVQVAEIIATSKDGQTRIITEANIVQGGLKIDRYSVTGSKIEVGSAVAAELSLKLRNYDGEFDDFSFEGASLYVKIGAKSVKSSISIPEEGVLGNFILGESALGQSTDTAVAAYSARSSTGDNTLGNFILGTSALGAGSSTDDTDDKADVIWLPCGRFIVDTPPRKLSTITLSALDYMVKFDKDVDTSKLSFPCHVDNLISQLCTVCGVALATDVSNFPNHFFSVSGLPANNADSLTYRQLLQWCAMLTGTCGFMDDEGQLVLKWYEQTSVVVTPSERYTSDMLENDIAVTGFTYKDSNNNTYVAGTTEYPLDISDCGFLTNSYVAALRELNKARGGFAYRPYSATIKAAPYLFPLDMIWYRDKSGTIHQTVVTNVTFGLNCNTSISGAGETTTSSSYSQANGGMTNQQATANRETNDKIDAVDKKLDEASKDFSDFRIEYSSDFRQLQDSIEARVTKDTYYVDMDGVSERIASAETNIKQNADGITLRATKSEAQGYADGAEKKAKTYADAQLKVTANEISTKVTAAQNTANSAQADANALKTRVEKAETSIKQNASNITLKASKTEAQSYANSAKDSAVSESKTYTDAQIKVSADEIKLGVAKTSHDPLNYAQLNKDTAAAWGFTAADEADGVWYTLKSLKRDTSISDRFSCEGGEKLRVQGTISTTVKGNSSSGGTDSVYRNCSIMVQCCDATYKNYSWSASTSVSNSTQKIDSTITIPTNARYFNIFVHVESWGNFSGAIKVKNIEVSKVGALDARLTKAETSITQTANDITLRATKTEAQGYANTAESNAKKYSDSQLKITSDSITTKVSTAQGTADAAKTAAATAQSTANTAKTNAATAQADANALKTRVEKAETSIKQNASNITLKASKTEAQSYANSAKDSAVSESKTYTDAQIKVSADEIKLGVAKTSHDPLNYAQLNKDTAAAWGFTAADEADGVWYTLKSLKRDTSISDRFSCEGGEKLRVQGTISTTVKGNSSSGGTDSVYRNCSIMVQCCDATYKNYSWSASTSVSNSTQKIDSTITIPTNARYFNIFVHVESWGNFSGAIKVKNIEVSKVGALDARLTKAETSITQTANDITLRATKTEAQGYANTAESNAKKYSDSQLKITSDSITTKVSTAQGTADAAKTAAATAQSTANTAKTNAATAQSDVNALKTRVTNAETSIKQTANDITLKASKTEVSDAKKEAIDTAAKDATTKANTAQTNAVNAVTKYTDAQIQTLAGEINLKASQKSVNDLSGRVDSAVASINVNAGAIEMKASKTEAQGYANKAESNAKTAAASDATTKANNAKTAAINAAATDATNKANAAEKNAKNELYSMMTFTADNGLVITHSGWSGKVQITGQNIQVIRGNNKVIVNDNGISITDGTSSCSIGTSGVSITDSKGSVNINSGSLTFKGVKNNVELFKNDATTYAAQTYTVDLSRYAAILVTFRSNKGGTWFAGGGNAGLVSMIVPVNGVEMSMVYPWNTVHKRSITAYTDKIVFGTGYQRTSRYNLGVVNYFDLETPWSDDWKTDNTKCVPYKIYGFL